MEIKIINKLKDKKSKKNNKEEEAMRLNENNYIIVKNVDINQTVKILKKKIYDELNLKNVININRIGISFTSKKVVNNKEETFSTFLSDDEQQLLFYDNISYSDTIFYIKDIGPQINYRAVYIIEYLGPLLSTIFFFIRYCIIFNNKYKNNQDKALPINIILYFLMSFFHYIKRIAESIFVHIFSRSTMPLINLFKNCFYYWIIYGGFCCFTLFNPNSEEIKHCKIIRYIFVLFFMSAELKNLKTHLILREIKIKGKGKKYMPPKIEGFELVTCANYLWEFFSWMCFSIFSMNIFIMIFTIYGFFVMKNWALKKHKIMLETYKEKYPKNIYAFIPYFI